MKILTAVLVYGVIYWFDYRPLLKSGEKKEAILYALFALAAAGILTMHLSGTSVKGPLMVLFKFLGDQS